MTKKYVLITRPADQAIPIADEIDALGLIPVIEPMLQIVPLEFVIERDYTALIFTSANAVRVAAGKIKERGHKVYCVGGRTAETALDRGWQDVVSADGDVSALNDLLAKEKPEGRLLHLSGEDIAAPVEGGGLEIDRIPVYKAEQAERFGSETFNLMMRREFSYVLFFSTRSAQAFALLARNYGCIEPLTVTKALCLSDSVVKSIEHLPWQEILVAAKPDRAAMLDLLKKIEDKQDGSNE